MFNSTGDISAKALFEDVRSPIFGSLESDMMNSDCEYVWESRIIVSGENEREARM